MNLRQHKQNILARQHRRVMLYAALSRFMVPMKPLENLFDFHPELVPSPAEVEVQEELGSDFDFMMEPDAAVKDEFFGTKPINVVGADEMFILRRKKDNEFHSEHLTHEAAMAEIAKAKAGKKAALYLDESKV